MPNHGQKTLNRHLLFRGLLNHNGDVKVNFLRKISVTVTLLYSPFVRERISHFSFDSNYSDTLINRNYLNKQSSQDKRVLKYRNRLQEDSDF